MALTDSLIAYYSLEEASGSAIDAHAAYDLTENNTIGTVAGKVGNARQFESANSESFSIADNADFSSAAEQDLTLQAWVYLDTVGGTIRTVAGKGNLNAGGNTEYLMWVGTDALAKFTVGAGDGVNEDTASASTFGALSTGTWYHLVGRHDAVNNQIRISVNGTHQSKAYSGGSCNLGGQFRIGGTNANNLFFNGRIDEVAFWKRHVSDAEVAELYNGGTGLAYDELDGGGGFVAFPRPRGLRAGMMALTGGAK